MSLDPKHLAEHFSKAIDQDGPTLVDHTKVGTPATGAHSAIVKDYQANVAHSGNHIANDLSLPGSVNKVFVKTPTNQFMVKAYHEPVAFANTKQAVGIYPYTGWAESVTQALYHAGGLGHLIQHSHVAEHILPDKSRHPFVVIGFDKSRLHPTKDFHKAPGPKHYHLDLYHDLGRMGVMDFLTNNIDRTGNNTLWGINPDSGKPHVLAIDHQYAFQYLHPLAGEDAAGVDNLLDYWIDQRGISGYDHPGSVFNKSSVIKVLDTENLRKVGAWWLKNSNAIRKAYQTAVDNSIKDESVKSFLHQSFLDRARALDNFGVAFASAPVLDYFDRSGAGSAMASVKMVPHSPVYPWGPGLDSGVIFESQ